MSDDHYRKALEAAKKEIAELLPQHSAIEQRIAKLHQTIATLTALSEDVDSDDDDQVYVPSELRISAAKAVAGMIGGIVMGTNMALSDAVREVLKASGKPLTPMQVRDGLVRMGIDLEKKYTNPLAVIHRSLKRLKDNGEVIQDSDAINGTTYKWKSVGPVLQRPTRRQIRLANEAAERGYEIERPTRKTD